MKHMLFAVALSAGCLDAAPTDELATEQFDGTSESDNYYHVRFDYRRCASPMCGGVFVARVNRTKTTCLDGTKEEECYLSRMDMDQVTTDPETMDAIYTSIGSRSGIVRATFDASESYGVLRVTEAWRGAGPNEADGVFVMVKDNGRRCLTEPCSSMTESRINSTVSADIARLDWSDTGVSEDEAARATTEAMSERGLIVAGYRVGRGNNKGRSVTRYFTRVTEPALATCYVGGCSNQLCTDQPDMVSTCEWRDEYACYSSASCQRQPNGLCSWTPTVALEACLSGAQ